MQLQSKRKISAEDGGAELSAAEDKNYHNYRGHVRYAMGQHARHTSCRGDGRATGTRTRQSTSLGAFPAAAASRIWAGSRETRASRRWVSHRSSCAGGVILVNGLQFALARHHFGESD